jgi:regulator of protease activity HflC (stomatin/prohibitin superfamily)
MARLGRPARPHVYEESEIEMIIVFVVLALLGLVLLGSAVRVITQYERGVVLRFGRVRAATRGPGLALIVPFVDRLHRVNM